MPLFGTWKRPKGPFNFSFYERTKDLSSTIVKFTAPRHNLYGVVERKDKYNIYDHSIYQRRTNEEKDALFLSVFNETWGYSGIPLFGGNIGSLLMSISVLSKDSYGSFFIPNNLLAYDNDQIQVTYGPLNDWHRYDSHQNWGTSTINNTKWIHYENTCLTIDGDGTKRITDWLTPIDDHYILSFDFIAFLHVPKYHGFFATCDELIDKIMNSCTVQLSPTAERHKQEAFLEYPDARYPESMPPIHWTERLPSEIKDEQDRLEAKERRRKIIEELDSYR